MVHEELSTMFLWRDWIFVHLLQYFSSHHINFVATRGTTVGTHAAFDHQGRFLAESFESFPGLRVDRVLQDHALHNAGAVPQLGKQDLPARTQVVEPALED